MPRKKKKCYRHIKELLQPLFATKHRVQQKLKDKFLKIIPNIQPKPLFAVSIKPAVWRRVSQDTEQPVSLENCCLWFFQHFLPPKQVTQFTANSLCNTHLSWDVCECNKSCCLLFLSSLWFLPAPSWLFLTAFLKLKCLCKENTKLRTWLSSEQLWQRPFSTSALWSRNEAIFFKNERCKLLKQTCSGAHCSTLPAEGFQPANAYIPVWYQTWSRTGQ